ncbi:hypothetical protein NPIL_148511 [Nephila pilipes]|uniref:Uncharacterized protein n=1 Tax=Nephila pilipes TaxID=299642 RepID=A0A8X6NQR4_NEPPI|nr:hypothetical protein NPIL_148511 [Nephila pilipes]
MLQCLVIHSRKDGGVSRQDGFLTLATLPQLIRRRCFRAFVPSDSSVDKDGLINSIDPVRALLLSWSIIHCIRALTLSSHSLDMRMAASAVWREIALNIRAM